VADGERGGDQAESRRRAAEQQQAEQEQDVVGANQDVLDAGRYERAEHRAHALPRAGVVVERGMPGVEDGLVPQRLAFVDVDERLVRAVVREEHRVDVHAPRCLRGVEGDVEAQALTIGHGDHAGEPHRHGRAVEQERETPLQHRGQRRPVSPGHGGIEQGVGVGELQFVGGVEVVDGERAVHAGRRDREVEIAERRRVGERGRGGQPEAGQQDHQHDAHGRQCIAPPAPL
jgi:hypothetical protein